MRRKDNHSAIAMVTLLYARPVDHLYPRQLLWCLFNIRTQVLVVLFTFFFLIGLWSTCTTGCVYVLSTSVVPKDHRKPVNRRAGELCC